MEPKDIPQPSEAQAPAETKPLTPMELLRKRQREVAENPTPEPEEETEDPSNGVLGSIVSMSQGTPDHPIR